MKKDGQLLCKNCRKPLAKRCHVAVKQIVCGECHIVNNIIKGKVI